MNIITAGMKKGRRRGDTKTGGISAGKEPRCAGSRPAANRRDPALPEVAADGSRSPTAAEDPPDPLPEAASRGRSLVKEEREKTHAVGLLFEIWSRIPACPSRM